MWPWRLVVWFLNGPAVYIMVGLGALAGGPWAGEWLDDRTAHTNGALLIQGRQAFVDSARPADEARCELSAMRGERAKVERAWSVCTDLASADYSLLVVVLDEGWPANLRPYLDELAAALATEQTAATDCAQERDEEDLTAASKRMDTTDVTEAVAIVRAALRLRPADGVPLDRGCPPPQTLAQPMRRRGIHYRPRGERHHTRTHHAGVRDSRHWRTRPKLANAKARVPFAYSLSSEGTSGTNSK